MVDPMADPMDIAPDFGVKYFDTAEQAEEFLQKLGFKMINQRSDYDVWETVKEPKKRAISHEEKDGRFVAKQLIED